MFERFTESARNVVVEAQVAARELKHNYIGGEHLLAGLLVGDHLARKVLEGRGIDRERVVAYLREHGEEGDEIVTGQIPFTPRTRKMLECALREALALGHNYIGPEHILLGMVRDTEGIAARILDAESVTADDVRNDLMKLLSAQPNTQYLIAWTPRVEQETAGFLEAVEAAITLLDKEAISLFELRARVADVAEAARTLEEALSKLVLPKKRSPDAA